jgi:hypothetical protein
VAFVAVMVNFGSHKNGYIGTDAENWLARTETHSVPPSNVSKFDMQLLHHSLIISNNNNNNDNNKRHIF